MKHNRVKTLLVLCVTTFFVGRASEAQWVQDSGGVCVGTVIGASLSDGKVVVPFYAGSREFALTVKRRSIYGQSGYFPNSACEGAPLVNALSDGVDASILPAAVVVGSRVFVQVQNGDPTTITAFSVMQTNGLCVPFE